MFPSILLPHAEPARKFIPLGVVPEINKGRYSSLISAYVPGSGNFGDLLGVGPKLARLSASARGSGRFGHGELNNAANMGLSAVLPSALKFSSTVSIVWVGVFVGTPDVNCDLFGATYDNAASSPFLAWQLFVNGAGQFSLANDLTGGFNNISSTTPSTGTLYVIGGSIKSGSQVLYINGVSSATGSSSGSFAYTATSHLDFGGTFFAQTLKDNCVSLLGLVFSSFLSAADHADIARNPFQFLIYPEDRLAAILAVGPAAAPPANNNYKFLPLLGVGD